PPGAAKRRLRVKKTSLPSLRGGWRERRCPRSLHPPRVHLSPIRFHGQQVAPRAALLGHGLTPYRLRNAVTSGRWQEPLPGVFVSHSGPLTRQERWHAALYFAGPDAALSHR